MSDFSRSGAFCTPLSRPLHSSILTVHPTYVTFNLAAVDEQVWYPDSVAASRMTPDDSSLLSKTVYSGSALVKVGDGTLLPVVHVGNTSLISKHRPLTLKNVLHMPKVQLNLLSIRKLSGTTIALLFLARLLSLSRTTP